MIHQIPYHIIPKSDSERLSKLHEYQILDTPAEEAFDNIARLASQIFDTPGAYVTFVDKTRVFFKANMSDLEGNEVPRNQSLCSLAILDKDVTVYNDTHSIPELTENPLVHCSNGIRFYAGAPLKSPEGHLLGTVCVTDTVPREVTEKQLNMLAMLASIVVEELESRLRSKKALKIQVDLMNNAVHELKNPAANIQLAVDMLKNSDLEPKVRKMVNMINKSVKGISDKLGDLLSLSKMEDGSFQLDTEEVDVVSVLDMTVRNFELLAKQKGQTIVTRYESPRLPIKGDRTRIKDVFHNLLSNAIKFSYHDTHVNVTAEQKADRVEIGFHDQGQGLNDTDKDKLFVKFAKLSAIPTGKERSTGLGLSICKTLVEMHRGNIWAESEGLGKGSSFYISLPVG